jgi:NhaP-type Na+/H+ or K+/H+ antiporter
MHENALLLVAIGALFLGGLALDKLGRIVHIPRVTLLILLGALLGPPMLDWLPQQISDGNETYAAVALTMVAFLLGSSLSRKMLRMHGREILSISISVVLASALVVSVGLILLGAPLPVALLLGGIAAATDPAATHDVIRQSGAKGLFTTNLKGIVAIDDAWGLIAFSLLLTLAAALSGADAADGAIALALWETFGGIALGAAVGFPAAYLTGRLKPGEPSLVEALGLVALCSGLALYLDVSFLLAGMVCGMVVVNFARHHDRPFHEIERIEWPFLLLFFVMAGASLDIAALVQIGWIGVGYCVLRFASRLLGGLAGGSLVGKSPRRGALIGLALMPQAGVAIGMALVASRHFPEFGETLLTIAIASTVFFEVVGPLTTQLAIRMAARADKP